MKRTIIVLSGELATLIEREGQRRGVPAATVVRDALDTYFSARSAGASTVDAGRSSETQIARDMEDILAREWTYELIMGVADSDPAAQRSESFTMGEEIGILPVRPISWNCLRKFVRSVPPSPRKITFGWAWRTLRM